MEKGTSEIEISVVSRDGEEKRTDALIREEEVVVRRDGEIFVEDTSRHCAIDKAIGLAIRDEIDLSNSLGEKS